jgi:hypothetical protein
MGMKIDAVKKIIDFTVSSFWKDTGMGLHDHYR